MTDMNLSLKSGLRFSVLYISLIFFSNTLSSQSIDTTNVEENKKSFPTVEAAGFIQQHFTVDNITGSPAQFSIHRARLGVRGSISEKIKYNFIIGAVEPPDRSPALVNGFIDIEFHPLFNLRTGQFLVPFGLEGPEPIFLNPAIERSFPTRRLNPYRMFRDVGINIFGRYSIVNYSLSIVNGKGANIQESIEPKDFLLRLNFLLTPNFMAGISGQTGRYETGSLDIFSRQRAGAHFEFNDAKSKNRFRGEFIYLDRQVETDVNEISMGGYLLYGYKFSENLESIYRLEYYRPDNHDNTYYGLTLGGNYLLADKTRVSLNCTGYTETGNLNNIQFLSNIQLQYVL
jgi:hypothetical protein